MIVHRQVDTLFSRLLINISVFLRLCLSISDFHPDTWNPAWSVSTILTGLLSFMVSQKPLNRCNSFVHDDKMRLQISSISIVIVKDLKKIDY